MSTFEERARARAKWPIREIALGDEPLTDARDASTVDERIALVAELTRAQWRLAGWTVPRYDRAQMPGRILRAHR